MIVEFSCKNFRSFKDTAVLSLVAEKRLKGNSGDDSRVFQLSASPSLLLSTGLFGLNAGGKTNMFKALKFAVHVISNTDYDNQPIMHHPLLSTFLLDKDSENKPVEMEISLWDKHNNAEYTYGFNIGEKGITQEWLYVASKKMVRVGQRRIFQRDGQKFKFGDEVDNSIQKLTPRVRADASAVSVFSQFNHPESKRLVDLVKPPMLNILNVESSSDSLDYAVDNHKDIESFKIMDVIKQADLSILDIDLDKKEVPFSKLDSKFKKNILPFMSRVVKEKGQLTMRKAVTMHQKYDSNYKRIGQEQLSLKHDESRGTQMFIGLITAAIETLNAGGALVVDELGASMHPFLSKMVIDQFDNKQSNPSAGQIIYNSHETYLLSQEMRLRRDQIWLADKNKYGESYLKRLSEYKTRKDFDIARNYLAGRFGAIPFIGESLDD